MSEPELKSELEVKIENKPQKDQEQIQAQLQPNVFKCYMCDLHSKYVYYGTRPLDRHLLNKNPEELTSDQKNYLLNSGLDSKKETIVLLEKSYICDDPFSQTKSSNYLVLGANCYLCKKMVCVAPECSLFYYTKRFCLNCARTKLDQFPIEIKQEILKLTN